MTATGTGAPTYPHDAVAEPGRSLAAQERLDEHREPASRVERRIGEGELVQD